jgi:hypothetical protein
MAYLTIVAVVEVPDEEMPPETIHGDDPDDMLELARKQFGELEGNIRFITGQRGVTATAIMEGADPSLWPEGTEVGAF